jgi:putative transposase
VGVIASLTCVQVDWLLASFGQKKSTAIIAYKQFVARGVGQSSPWGDLINQVYLGGEQFVENSQRLLEKDKDLSEIPQAHRRLVAKSLSEYQNLSTSRDQAIVMAYDSGGYKLKEIGDYFGLHYSRISRIVKKAKGKT